MNLAHLRKLDLNLLLALHALSSERHVTKSAKRIGITQSAMSHALARLRQHFGDELFVRSPGGLVPTPRALALEGPLKAALADLDRALAPDGALDLASLDRTFVVGASDYAEAMTLPKIFAKLRAEAPKVVVLQRPFPNDVELDLERGQLDLAVGLPIGLTPRLVAPHLFDERFVCVVREGHPTVKKKLGLDQFLEIEHVQISPRGRPGGPVDSALEALGKRRRIALYTPHFLSALLIVAESDLVLTIAERLALRVAAALSLRILPTPLPVTGFSVHAIWHERVNKDPAHAWFRNVVAGAARTPRHQSQRSRTA